MTKKPEYLDAAKQILAAMGTLERDVRSHDPWVSYVDSEGYYWIEDFPGSKDHALSGFMLAIFGLYDFYVETGDPSARALLQRALTTLKSHLDQYRRPGEVSYYCLGHRHIAGNHQPFYVEQLEYLHRYSPDPHFFEVSHQMQEDCPRCGDDR